MSLTIDITGHLPAVGFNPDQMMREIQILAEMARTEWIRLAQTQLRSTSAEYAAGIQPVEVGDKWAAIRLAGWLPNAIEQGHEPYDMKPGLLNGPHSKVTKKGVRYNTVPFRHGTPGTGGRNVGAPMPVTGSTKAGKPSSLVYNVAKRLSISSETASGKTTWGGKTGDLGGLGMRSMLPVPGGRPGGYTWKHSPYQGIYKVQKFYAKVAQNQYVSFRRVSSNSDPNSWWHPGFQAKRLSDQVVSFINAQIKRRL